LVKLHPDLQWAGQDVTWAGAHEFDASVDITGNVGMDGDLTVDGKLAVDSSCDLSDVYVDGDISVKGSLKVAVDFSLSGDMAVDGTSNLTGAVRIGGDLTVNGKIAVDSSCDFSDVYVDGDISVKGSLDVATDLSVAGNIAVDGTAAKFGESLGIGLFYDPTAQAAAQSTTSANGSIHKMGTEVVAANTTDDVVYAVAFPTAFRSALCSFKSNQINMNTPCQVFPKAAATKTTLQVTNSSSAQQTIYWHAWGY
jgi:cytoskeletal protein CcmA (bactofilin family)